MQYLLFACLGTHRNLPTYHVWLIWVDTRATSSGNRSRELALVASAKKGEGWTNHGEVAVDEELRSLWVVDVELRYVERRVLSK